VTFVNETPDTLIELFWENKFTGERKTEGTIAPRGGFLDVHTFVGHEFSYDLHGARHYFAPSEPNSLGQQFAVIAEDSTFSSDVNLKEILEKKPSTALSSKSW